MALETDNRNENMLLDINRTLLFNYGNNLVLSRLKEKSLNDYDVELDYNKIFHIKDERTNTVFVRNIRFKKVFETALKYAEELELPLDEINSTISSQYELIKNSLIISVLSRKDLVLTLIKNTHIFSAFLNKFYTILNQLVINEKFNKLAIEELAAKRENFKKYISLVIQEGFGELDQNGNLISTNKLKTLFKREKDIKSTVDEALFLLIKNHYDYIVYELNIHTLKSYVNIVSSLIYLIEYMKLKDIKMKIGDFYRIYLSFHQHVDFDKFLERLNNLIYSNVVTSVDGIISLSI